VFFKYRAGIRAVPDVLDFKALPSGDGGGAPEGELGGKGSSRGCSAAPGAVAVRVAPGSHPVGGSMFLDGSGVQG